MRNEASSLLPWESPALALSALAWVAVAAADLILLLGNPASRRVMSVFSILDRAILVGFELVALVPACLLLGWLIHRVSGIGKGRTASPRSSVGPALASLLGGTAGLLFGASWLAFLMTGKFLNGTGVRLWMANPLQIARHTLDMASGPLLALVPVCFVFGAVLLGYGLPRLANRISRGSRRSLNRKLALVNAILPVHLEEDPGESVDLADEAQEWRAELERRPGSWIEAQIDYYGTLSLYRRWYPPKLVPAGGEGRTSASRDRRAPASRPRVARAPARGPRGPSAD